MSDNNRKKRIDKKNGFTLVELLVSVALFSIVMTVAISAILNIVDVNRKAQSLKSVMNNLNFSVESITRTMKTCSSYSLTGSACGSNGSDDITIGDAILTDDTGAIRNVNGHLPWVRYKRTVDLSNNHGRIQKTDEFGSSDYITASEIDIQKLCFYVFGQNVGDNIQPRVFMVLQGVGIDPQKKTSTDFSLQTTVSQRLIDS